jgi:hypothetical protein
MPTFTRVLFLISILALAALLCTSIAIVRHVRRNSRSGRNQPESESPPPAKTPPNRPNF